MKVVVTNSHVILHSIVQETNIKNQTKYFTKNTSLDLIFLIISCALFSFQIQNSLGKFYNHPYIAQESSYLNLWDLSST